MRHDLNYRRVLRSKDQYMMKYKLFGFAVLVGYQFKDVYEYRMAKFKESSMKTELQKIKDKDKGEELENACILFFYNK
jgi:hypothetical protein